MVFIVTRMPSTGALTNFTTSDDRLDEVKGRWNDVDHVHVYELFGLHAKAEINRLDKESRNN